MSPEEAVGSSIVIAGPTGVGKTALALAIGRLSPGAFEIVSADSIQVYRRFDIGSAKPSAAERAEIPFHVIDIVEPDEDFTLVDFQSAAIDAVVSIVKRGKTPLIVGGTGLYIRSITKGLGVPVAGPDETLRAAFVERAKIEGTAAIHDQLKLVDPKSAARIHENDLKRIVRALEVFTLSGRPLSRWHEEDAARERPAPLKYFVLNRDRDKLYTSIDQRTEAMFRPGILDEVTALRNAGYPPYLKPMTSLGYLQANQVIDGKLIVQQAIDLTKTATHQYARRQLIWFRGENTVEWIELEGKSVESVARELLESAEIRKL